MSRIGAWRRRFAHSLLLRLWGWITAILIVVALFTALISSLLGFQEAKELQDLQLRQVASLVHGWNPAPATVLAPGGREHAADTAIVVERIAGLAGAAKLPLPRGLADGMHTIAVAGGRWRVFVEPGRAGRIAVAQRTAVREEAALDSAQYALFPVLALIPVLVVLSAWVVRRGLQPIHSLAAQIDARGDDRLDRLAVESVPYELRPFIASINRLLARLGALLERERRFVADAAHELRTPIAALSLQVDNLANADLPAAPRERLRNVQQALARTRAVTEQLLSLARAQSGRALARRVVDPSAVLRQVVEDLLPLAEQRRVDLGMSRDAGAPIMTEPMQFYTLLRNALDNALRYTPEGGRVDLAVHTDEDPDAARTVIEIVDSGPGIAPEDLERAFEPFERLDDAADTPGSGLGLAIMRRIAANLGGRLQIDNRPQGGLRVRYSEPVA
ncbi:MAG TPA: ATP-binding protein [Steroidobacteraceae bacterium]|nr:ATP-binding protein [Steroidobacteraceae bacterium]